MAKRHPGTIERRGRSLRVILYAGGKRHSFTLRTADVREAREFARRKHAELERLVERQSRGLPGAIPVSALFDKYMAERLPLLAPATRRTYLITLGFCRAFFEDRLGNPRVEQVRPGHVNEYLHWRRSGAGGRRPAGNRTLQKDRATLHAVFAFAEELELREGNPVTRVAVPKADSRDPVILSDEQYKRLIEECAAHRMLALYALVLGETGMRCESEALYLRWEDVDLEKGFIEVVSGRDGHRTKSGKSRWVPMTDRLKRAVKQHFADFRFARYDNGPSQWVFHHPRSRRRASAGDRIASMRNSFGAAARRAGVADDFNQHDLRHRRVTTWLAAGQSPALVKEAVGHADLRTTMSYSHLAREHLLTLVHEAHGPSLLAPREA